MKRIPIDISLYDDFCEIVEDIYYDNNMSNRLFHKAIEKQTGFKIYHKPLTGVYVFYFTPADATLFLLKYEKSQRWDCWADSL